MHKTKEYVRADAFRLEMVGLTPLTKEQATEKRQANERRRQELRERRARKQAVPDSAATGR